MAILAGGCLADAADDEDDTEVSGGVREPSAAFGGRADPAAAPVRNSSRSAPRRSGLEDLAEAYGLSRPTVRQAIARLVDQGLLVRKRGVGATAKKPEDLLEMVFGRAG